MPGHPLRAPVSDPRRVQLEAPAGLHAAVADVVVPALLLAVREGGSKPLQRPVREVRGRDHDEGVDDVFAHEAGDGGAADVFDGEVGDVGEGEVEGELRFYFLEVAGPCFSVCVDPDLHFGGRLGVGWVGLGFR